ncbi:hypothetical protein QFZ82_005624 [Streptomyces sp. V4I23]|nr:hypothetical protein [Streptomyces sp. V4I23]
MHDLVDIAPVDPEDGKVAQYSGAAAQRQRLGEAAVRVA